MAADAQNLEDTVARAKTGDRDALERLLEELAPAIYRFSMRMCRQTSDAEDVVQDTLLSVAQNLPAFEGHSSLSSWVFTLTRTSCSRRRRGMKNRPAEDDSALLETADLAPSPETRAADHELADALGRALDTLSDEHREVIQLRDVEGLTAPEAAEALGVSVDALKSRLFRAREALRLALRPLLEPAIEPAVDPAQSSCPDVVALWSKKLDGDLSQHDCAAMEKHIETCRHCGSACQALKRALLACQNVRTREVPPEVQRRVREAMKAWTGALR